MYVHFIHDPHCIVLENLDLKILIRAALYPLTYIGYLNDSILQIPHVQMHVQPNVRKITMYNHKFFLFFITNVQNISSFTGIGRGGILSDCNKSTHVIHLNLHYLISGRDLYNVYVFALSIYY